SVRDTERRSSRSCTTRARAPSSSRARTSSATSGAAASRRPSRAELERGREQLDEGFPLDEAGDRPLDGDVRRDEAAVLLEDELELEQERLSRRRARHPVEVGVEDAPEGGLADLETAVRLALDERPLEARQL